MRVLITNYSASSQVVLKAIMIKLGHQLEVVADGKAALACLQRPNGPAMAIMDSYLPGVDGFEVCRRIKADEEYADQCVILMTKENDRSEVLKALDAGADDYLQKPFDLTEVSARLRVFERFANERKQLREALAASAGNGGLEKPSLLLVDDEKGVRQSLKSVFKEDYNVFVADNAPAGLEMVRKNKIQAAVLDISMEGMSGIELLKEIKEISPLTEVIMLTAYATVDTAREAVHYHACDYINKPFEVPELREAVARAVERNRANDPNATPQQSVPGDNHANGAVNGSGHNGKSTAGKNGVVLPVKLFSEKHAALNAMRPFSAFDAVAIKALGDMGLGTAVPVEDADAKIVPELGVFSVVIVPQKSAWLDIVIEMDFASAGGIFKAMTGMDEASPEDCADMAAETLNIVQGAIKTALQDEYLDVLTPVIPIRVPADKRDPVMKSALECTARCFSLPGITIRIMLFPHLAPVVQKTLYDIKLKDVVAEPVFLPGDAKLTLLNKGIIMNDHHVQKLREMTGYGSVKMKFDMIVPSEISSRLVVV